MRTINFIKSTLLFSICALISLNIKAGKYYVNDNALSGDIYCTAIGNNANNGTSPSAPKSTLSSILSTYSAVFVLGDTIFVDSGTYSGYNGDKDLSSPINGVVIKGAGIGKTMFANFTSSGAYNYWANDHFFMIIDDNNTVLMDFKIAGYNAQTSGIGQTLGVAANKSGIKILNILVESTSTTSSAMDYPIVISSGASVLFNGGGAACNAWDAGGGIKVQGATTNVTINNYQFVGNKRMFLLGTALKVEAGFVTVNNSRFEKNAAEGDQRGAAIYVATGTVTVSDCFFDANETRLSYDQVGGTILIDGGVFKIKRSILSNHVQTGGSSSYGAGIGVSGGTVSIDSCKFINNNGKNGNDVYVKGGAVIAKNCTFASTSYQIGQSATGTFSISNCGTPSIYGTVITTNTMTPTYTASPAVPGYTGSCPSISINPICNTPTVTITGNATFCAGSSATLTVAGGSSYLWSIGSTSSVITTTISGVLTVTATNASGCKATKSITITANPTPTASITGNTTICSGQTTTLTTSGGTSYLWNTGVSTNTISTGVAGIITVTVTNSNGCKATKSVTITVNPTPTAAITGSTTICAGQTTTLTASGGTSYLWNTGITTNTISTGAAGVITVTVTNSNGCKATKSVTITVNPTPTAAITGSTTICTGQATTLSASGGGTYAWSTGSTTSTISTGTAGVLTVTVTNTGGCVNVKSVTIITNPLPVASYSFMPCKCILENTSLFQVGTIGTGISWSVINPATNAVIATSTDQALDLSLLPNISLTIILTVTNSNGCSASYSGNINNVSCGVSNRH